MRTVGVELEAKTAGYQAGVTGAAKATKSLSDNVTEVVAAAKAGDSALGGLERSLRGSGRAAKAAGNDFDSMKHDLEQLDRQILLTETGLASLAKGFAQSGNSGLLKEIRAQQSQLRQLTNVKNLLPKPQETETEARSWGRRLGASIGDGLGEVSTGLGSHVGLTIGAAAGIAAAPAIASALGAAVSAGAGALGIGAGVALAVKSDPKLQAAGKEAGHRFISGLESVADKSLQGPILGAIDQLAAAGDRVTKRWDTAFAALAPRLGPFTRDLITAGERINGSLVDAAVKSGPALAALGDSLVLVSQGVGSLVDSLASGGPQAADSLRAIAGATGDVAAYSGLVLKTFGDLANNPWLTGPLLPLLKGHYRDVAVNTKAAADNGTGLNSVYTGLVPTLGGVTGAARPLALTLQDIADAARDLHTANADLYSSETNVAQALADANKKIKENGKGLDLNTQKGRDNRAALDNVATALQNQYDKYVAVNGVVPGTKRLADDLRAKFIKLAEKAGLSADAAQTLANKILGIPKSKDIKIHANTHDAEGRIAALQAKINALHGRQLTIDLAYRVTGSKASRSAVAAALDKQSLPARASGGPVVRGMSYLVGENGPEVFTAPATGRIIPDGNVYGTYAANPPTWIAGGTGVTNVAVTVNAGWVANPQELTNLFAREVDKLQRTGRM